VVSDAVGEAFLPNVGLNLPPKLMAFADSAHIEKI